MLALITLFSLAMPLAAVLIPLFTGRAVDGSRGAIGLLILAATARFATHAIRRYLSGALSLNIQHDLRMRVFHALHSATPDHVATTRTGQVVSRTISDLSQIQGMLAMFPVMASAMIEALLILAIMYWLSWPLAILLTIQLPVLGLIAYFSRKRLYSATWDAQQQAADIASQVEESVTGIRVLKSFAQQPRELTSYTAKAARLYTLRMAVGKLTAKFQPALSAVPNLVLVATIVLGSWLALQGTITIGEFLTSAAYVTLLSRMSRMAAGMLVTVHLASAAVQRVQELIDTPQRKTAQQTAEIPNEETTPHSPESIEPIGISGTYQTLSGDTLEINIPAGTTVAIEGGAGSGKTHLAESLAGYSQSDATGGGSSFWLSDGTKLLDLPESKRPTIVFEEPFLYSASIRDNIRLGFPASDADVLAAAEAACARDFIDDLGGLDTQVGERGLSLSGGQRQRIALARAILRNPRILILDSATSAIDALTEQRIVENLAARSTHGQLTTVLISHRRSTHKATGVNSVITLPDPPVAPLWPRSFEWNGLASEKLNAIPDPLQITTENQKLTLRSLVRLVPGLTLMVIVTLLIGLVADIALPSVVRATIDDGVRNGNYRHVLVLAAFGLVIALVSWLAAVLNTLLTTRTGEKLLYALRTKNYSHLLQLSIQWFERTASGRMMTRLTTDIDNLSNFLQSGLSQAIVSSTMLVGVLIMLVWTDPMLAGVAAVFLPIIGVSAWWFRRVSSRLYRAARHQVSTVNAEFQEGINGLRTGIAYNYGPQLTENIAAQSRRYLKIREKAQAAVSTFFPGISLITELAQALVLFVGTARIADGLTTQGALVAFSLYLTFFFGPVQQLSQIFDQFQQAKVSLDRISEFLGEPHEFAPSSGRQPGATASPANPKDLHSSEEVSVDLDNVRFHYGNHRDPTSDHPEILHGLNIDFRGTTALVGATGAGKSTIAKLVARWYDPTSGKITANDTDIRRYPLDAWRRHVGVVPQEAHLFRGNVAANIAYGKPDATQNEIEGAVGAIGGTDIIASIPGGFAGEVRERGEGLSAAQRQIISLARAELLAPPVMVLDEATSNLNENVEQKVVDAIARATSERTAIVIAHRLATAVHADRVVLLHHGNVLAMGTHAELLNNSEHYAQLWAAAENKSNNSANGME